MGQCALRSPEMKQNQALNRALERDFAENKRIVKILLLGTGNSGKSTILKQFKILHTPTGLGDAEEWKHIISSNIVRGMLTLAQGAKDLEEVTTDLKPDTRKLVDLLREYSSANIWHTVGTEEKLKISEICKRIWADEAVQEALAYDNLLPMLEVPMQYLMSNIDRIEADNYVPTETDILQSRARTSGVVSIDFTLDGVPCRMLDVGGQKNERKKWISHFDDVTAVLFLVSLSEFDKVLLEDNSINRMQDAFDVFKDIVECPYFERTNIILFLNKKDLFEEKIKKVDFKKYFPDYEGENEYTPAVDYICERFVKIFRTTRESQAVDNVLSDIYPFQTMATNTENVSTVFNMCKHIIFKSNLASTGML